MLTPLFASMIAGLIPCAIIFLTLLLSSRFSLDREKSSPFECGFDPKNKARLPFSTRFFLLAVIFLVFDVELALLLPLPIAFSTKHPLLSMINAISFLLILLLGLLHEWHEGSLEWSK